MVAWNGFISINVVTLCVCRWMVCVGGRTRCTRPWRCGTRAACLPARWLTWTRTSTTSATPPHNSPPSQPSRYGPVWPWVPLYLPHHLPGKDQSDLGFPSTFSPPSRYGPVWPWVPLYLLTTFQVRTSLTMGSPLPSHNLPGTDQSDLGFPSTFSPIPITPNPNNYIF